MAKEKSSPAVFDFSKEFNAERLLVLRKFMKEKGLSLEEVLLSYLGILYQKHVPKASRETLDLILPPLALKEKNEAQFDPPKEKTSE